MFLNLSGEQCGTHILFLGMCRITFVEFFGVCLQTCRCDGALLSTRIKVRCGPVTL